MMTVNGMPSPGRAAQNSEEVGAAGQRFAMVSDMLSKGELPAIPDNQKNLEGIAEDSLFSQ